MNNLDIKNDKIAAFNVGRSVTGTTANNMQTRVAAQANTYVENFKDSVDNLKTKRGVVTRSKNDLPCQRRTVMKCAEQSDSE
jgi:hypothetical protein